MSIAACGPGQSNHVELIDRDNIVRWALPDKLAEISGLALTSDQRLLAVTDEEAIVYELNYDTGELVKAFAFGEPTLLDDFEGIAVIDDTVWLMSSNGDLYSAPEGANGERVRYVKHAFRSKNGCELEGLAADHSSGTLIFICKDAVKEKDRLIMEWSPAGKVEKVRLPESAIAERIGKKRIHPSGIEIDPETGTLLIVASRENAVFALTRGGEFIDVIMRLDPDNHRQPEGITITDDGRLLIADEATSGPATLTIYGPKLYHPPKLNP